MIDKSLILSTGFQEKLQTGRHLVLCMVIHSIYSFISYSVTCVDRVVLNEVIFLYSLSKGGNKAIFFIVLVF